MLRPLYLFAVFLVLFELAAYLTNDMILPGMIQVIAEYHATQNYVALSMSYYLLGNCSCILLIGVLAEHFGKRRIILIGSLGFLLCVLLIMFSPNIHVFMAWRFFAGMGLAVISLAYALIHEHFNDKDAVKLTSIMSNITVLAPLAGPALGSLLVAYFSWRAVFVITALMAALSFLGMLKYTPRTPAKATRDAPAQQSWIKSYQTILYHPKFFRGVLLSACLSLPVFIWISQAPNLIFYTLHQGYRHYAIYQVISLGGLAISSVLMQFIAGKFRISQLIKVGVCLSATGLALSLFGFHQIYFIVIGMFVYNLGMGLASGPITRLLMSIKGVPSGMVASLYGFIQMILIVTAIIVSNKIAHHFNYSLLNFAIIICFFGLVTMTMLPHYLALHRDRAWQ
jgi:DHA1 family multidrug/chloramphenicol efflux transport protein-like MFS transporter